MNNQDCGGSFNDSSGWISSPDEDDDGRYDSNADCWWSIDPGPSMKVALSFTLFEVGYWVAFEPCTNDYLEVSSPGRCVWGGGGGGRGTLKILWIFFNWGHQNIELVLGSFLCILGSFLKVNVQNGDTYVHEIFEIYSTTAWKQLLSVTLNIN